MSGLEIAASLVTFIGVSREVVDGISRLAGLRHAPDILLALNNEVSDLQCVIDDLSELEQQHEEVLTRSITPSFYRSVEKAKDVFLKLEKLIAYDLTTIDRQTGQRRLDRSTWLRAQKKVEQAKLDLYRQSHRFGVVLDTLISQNAQFSNEISNRMVGIETQLNGLAGYVANSNGVRDPTPIPLQRFGADDGVRISDVPAGNSSVDHACSFPNLYFQVQRRHSCEGICHCVCHQTHRWRSPALAEKIMGNLFVGYAGFPTLFQKCNVLGCSQASPKVAKIAYKFPWWFWQRAVNIAFSWSSPEGPELLLRFPCIRSSYCDWFVFAKKGDAKGLEDLLERKQASGTLPYLPTTPDRRRPLTDAKFTTLMLPTE
ncbi:MAG: hypothetical protein Q9211_005211 [Gyalolechia sp. 1 TL-2023]